MALALAAGQASGAMLGLSTDSSDETSPAVLLGTFDFSVSGSTLTLTVDNDTAAPDAFRMSELYFNGPASLSGLTLLTPGWTFSTNVAADGFGVFRFALVDTTGQIASGGSAVLTFTMSGTATESDFVTSMSSIPPGDTPALIAAKFVQGPGDDSAFGATVPAPGPAALLALGTLGAARRRR